MKSPEETAHDREVDAKRRGERRDRRAETVGKVVKAMPSTNRRMRRAQEKLMRSSTSQGEKMRAMVKAEIDKKTAEVRQRIADGESLEDIRADLKRKP
jgi:hypothetical protein